MEKYIIEGGYPLEGRLRVHGSKNAVLPILAATVANNGVSVIENVPDIQDVWGMIAILESLGAKCSFEDGILVVNSEYINKCTIEKDLADKIRTSVLFCGALLARFGQASVAPPGGCAIGLRPINIHLDAFEKMGVQICQDDSVLKLSAAKLQGVEYDMEFPSVGATQNIMLAALGAEGMTVINNPAREPEIIELQDFLNGMGARIEGAGTRRIIVKGKEKLTDAAYVLKGDRIVAGTYMVACAAAGGNICLEGIHSGWCKGYTRILETMGCRIENGKDYVEVSRGEAIYGPGMISTAPYPGFPTDMQPQFMSLFAMTPGEHILKETIFENRFHNATELQKAGADIVIQGNTAFVHGGTLKAGQTFLSYDLRGGAALILAGLGIEGMTYVLDNGYIDRGYENIRRDLCNLGAHIT